MTVEELRATLEAAKNLLWQLLVEHERGQIDLRGEWKAQVDMMEKICTQTLEAHDDAGEDE